MTKWQQSCGCFCTFCLLGAWRDSTAYMYFSRRFSILALCSVSPHGRPRPLCSRGTPIAACALPLGVFNYTSYYYLLCSRRWRYSSANCAAGTRYLSMAVCLRARKQFCAWCRRRRRRRNSKTLRRHHIQTRRSCHFMTHIQGKAWLLEQVHNGIGVFFDTRIGSFRYKISLYIITYHVAIIVYHCVSLSISQYIMSLEGTWYQWYRWYIMHDLIYHDIWCSFWTHDTNMISQKIKLWYTAKKYHVPYHAASVSCFGINDIWTWYRSGMTWDMRWQTIFTFTFISWYH